MAAKGGNRKVHAVAFSFSNGDGHFTGIWAFVKGTSKDAAANKAVNLVVDKLGTRLDQVEYKTGLTEDELADYFDEHYTDRDGYLFDGITAQHLL